MHLIQNSPPQNSTSFPDWVQQVTWLPGLRGQISGLKRQISGLRGQVTCLKGQISGLRGEIQGLRGQISGLRGQILGLGGQISGLRGPGGDKRTNKQTSKWTNEWTNKRTDKQTKVPCVLQDFVPFGAAALPLIPIYNHTKQGNGYRWPHIALGRPVLSFFPH